MRSKNAKRLQHAGAGSSIGGTTHGAQRAPCGWMLAGEPGAAVHYRSIFHRVPVGIVHTTGAGRILEGNRHFCAMLGYDAEALHGLGIDELVHPADRGRHSEAQRRLLAGEIDRIAVQERLLRADGETIWVNRTVTTACDAANDAPYLIQVIEDITERMRTEALLERLRRARDVLASCNRVLVHAADEATMLADVCRIAVDHGGYKQAWIGLVTADALRPVRVAAHAGYADDAPPMSSPQAWAADGSYRGKMAPVVADGEPRIERDVFGDPSYVDRRQYAIRFGWGSSLTLALKAEGHILGAIEFNAREADAFDGDEIAMLTELAADLGFGISALRARLARAAAEAQARAHEQRYHDTFDQAAVGIAHTSFDGRFLKVNRRFCEMLGYDEAELVGRPARDFTHRDDRGKGERFQERMRAGELATYQDEKRYVRKDGSVLWASRTVSAARDACGQPTYFIRVIQDISERRSIERNYQATFDNAPLGIMHTAVADNRILRANRQLTEMLGYSEEELRERTSTSLVHPDLRGTDRDKYQHRLLDGSMQSFASERRLVRKDGSTVWVNRTVSLVRDAAGKPEYFIRIVEDISERVLSAQRREQAEQALRASEERYRDIFESNPLPMWVRDDETRAIVTVNQAAVDHYGYSREEFLRMKLRDIWDASEHDKRMRIPVDMTSGHITRLRRRHRTKDGRSIDVEVTARAFELDGRRMWLTLLHDVTERVRAEQKLVHLAHYDVLTGLPNRVLFYERLKHALVQAKRNDWITGVMFMDVDRFKNINDTLGHDVGDELLRQVSERLARSVRASDTVGRLGGDEFAVVLADLATPEDAALVAQKIMQNFNAPFRLAGVEIFVTTSIGITLSPHDGAEPDRLIKNADAAMYKAKEEGRNTYRYYTPEMSARALKLLTLEGSLRRALHNDEFLLHYQPKVSVRTGAITGVEALLRWRHPERGLVSPAEFIPVLEETGLIVQTSAWVLNALCRQLAQWRREGIDIVPVAMNLSAREFLAPDLARTIRRILESHEIAPSLLALEITESSLMVNPQEAAHTLEYLKQLGVGLAIDDFGTGYSSLSYLKRFPLDALKIDRSFVRDITSDANDAAITLAVISMAHSLGLQVVAEGVEDAAQLEFLARHGCDQVQGYFLARPMEAEKCAALLREKGVGNSGAKREK